MTLNQLQNSLLPIALLLAAQLHSLRAEGGDQPWQNSEPIPSVESGTLTSLDLVQQGDLAEAQQQFLKARDLYGKAVGQSPENSRLREHYAWFLYANGYHDKECLHQLELIHQSGKASNPTGIFNAIVEVRDELGLPEPTLKPPEMTPDTAVQAQTQPQAARPLPQAAPEANPLADSKPRAPRSLPLAGEAKTPVHSFQSPVPLKSELEQVEHFQHWTVVPTYSYSFFNRGRQSWQEEDLQLYYRVNRKLTIGAEVDIMQRPPSGTDTYYSAMASYYLWSWLEIHGKISVCPDPTFAASQIYAGGFIYQALPRPGVLMDYQRYEFLAGPIDQLNPGLTYNFTDETFLVVRYVRGWAFYNLEYNYYSAVMNLGLPGKRRLSLGFAYGTDPDTEIGTRNRNINSLSPAYNYYLFYTQPITRDLSLILGATYTYRLNQKGSQLYQQLTPTIGCSWKF